MVEQREPATATTTAPTGSSKAVASCPASTTTAAWRSCAAACSATPACARPSADADSEDVEQTLSVLHEPDYLEALGEVVRGAGGDPRADPSRPAARHPGLRRPGRAPPARGCARRSPRPSGSPTAPASPTPSAGRPATMPGPAWFAGYCYLNTAAAAVQTLREARRPAGRHPRHRPALPERHRGDRRDDGRREPALAARLAGDQRRRAARSTPSSEREHVVEFEGSPDADDLPRRRRQLDRRRWRSSRGRSSSRSATTSSPATRTAPGASRPRSSPRSARLLAASGLPVCVIQEGGYALDTLAACSHAFATGLLGGRPHELKRARGLPRAARPDRRGDRAPARRALRDLPRSRPTTRASTGSR